MYFRPQGSHWRSHSNRFPDCTPKPVARWPHLLFEGQPCDELNLPLKAQAPLRRWGNPQSPLTAIKQDSNNWHLGFKRAAT